MAELVTLFVILACIWTFIPDRLRVDVGPALRLMGAALWACVRSIGRGAGVVVRWLFGVERGEITSSGEGGARSFPIASSPRSPAENGPMEPPGTDPMEPVPALRSTLARLTDDEMLEELALLPGDVDGYRYADSRIAKFIGGRVDDRLAQVRDVRGRAAPIKGRALKVRDIRGEREIAF